MRPSTAADMKIIKNLAIKRNPPSDALKTVMSNRDKWYTSEQGDPSIIGEARKYGVEVEVHPIPGSPYTGYYAMAPSEPFK